MRLSLLAVLPILVASAAEAAPRGIRVSAPATLVNAGGTNTGSRLLYLNRCEGGCTISPGFEDSRTNHSSIIGSPRELSEWPHNDEDWVSMKRCVERLYAPFEIVVTDIDPGDQPHWEAIVAGTGPELGFPMAGGVAPFACGPIDNAMTFTFAALYDDMRALCNVVGQESAHAFGLDHEMQCNDPLTYLGGCPNKAFQDVDAPCGEFVERECDCGGETQNSYQYLLAFLGEGIVPEVQILEPADGALVPVGFTVSAQGIDDYATTRSELWIDERRVATADEPPFEFEAPRTLPPGSHQVEVRIFDDRNQFGSTVIEVEQAACEDRNDCDFAYLCVDGTCVLGPGNAEGIGATCTNSEGCQTELCAVEVEGEAGVCAATCESSPTACPYGFHCVTARGGDRLCIPENSGSGGFCQTGGSSGALGACWLILAAALGRRRYRCGK